MDLEISKHDVVNPEQCRQLLASAGSALKGVWHVAMVLQDTLFNNMSPDKWDLCNDVKVAGLKNLDEMTAGAELDAFVAFSSVSSLFGNVECPYGKHLCSIGSVYQPKLPSNFYGFSYMYDRTAAIGLLDGKPLQFGSAQMSIDQISAAGETVQNKKSRSEGPEA